MELDDSFFKCEDMSAHQFSKLGITFQVNRNHKRPLIVIKDHDEQSYKKPEPHIKVVTFI